MDILIIHRRGDALSTEHPLVDDRIVIGAGPEDSISLRDPGVDAEHFTLERAGQLWKLIDGGTAHGTRVNGGFVGRVLLKPGDRIEIADLEIEIVFRPEVPAPAMGAAPSVIVEGPSTATVSASAATVGPAPAFVPSPSASAGRRAAAQRRVRKFEIGVFVVTACIIGFILRWKSNATGVEPVTFTAQDRLDHVAQLAANGDADAARAALQAFAAEQPPAIAESELRGALEAIDAGIARKQEVAATLAGLDSESGTDFDGRLARIEAALARAAGLPEALQLEILRRTVERQIRTRDIHSTGPHDDRVGAALTLAVKSEFGASKDAFSKLAESGLAADRFLATHGAALAEAGARAVADDMLDRARLTLDLGEPEMAAAEIDPARVAGLRGTAAEAVVEEFIAGIPAAIEARNAKSGKSTKEGGEVARTPRKDSPPLQPPIRPEEPRDARKGIMPHTGATELEERLIAEADQLFRSGDTEGARRALDAMLPATSTVGRPMVMRRIDRSRRVLTFQDALTAHITEAAEAVVGVEVKTKDGATGRIASARDGKLLLRVGGADGGLPTDRLIVAADLVPESGLALAKKYTWKPEECLDLAAYSMIVGDPKQVDAALARALGEGNQRTDVDEMVALFRGLEVVPDWGFFRVEGQWITFQEREQRQYDKQVAVAVAKLDDSERGYEEGIAALNELMPVAPAIISRDLGARRAKLIAGLDGLAEWDAIGRLYEKRADLEKARKHALELIFDEVKYFYPYNPPEVPPDIAKRYPAVQKEVDERVGGVRVIWGDEHAGPPKGVTLSSQFRKCLKALSTERAILGVCDTTRRFDEPGTERIDLLPATAIEITVRDIAIDMSERSRLDMDAEVLAYNERATTSAAPQDVEQIRITNEYRRMMGRRALALDEKLIRSTRGHSEWMSRSGKFSHFNDEDQKLRTPGDRVIAQGYSSGGSGENIALTGGGAMGAHQGWCHSSGHHRNLLYEGYTEMGVAGVGRYWTQNFGGGKGYEGNLVGQDH